MKRPKLDDYELFYMEIRQSDYLNDLETTIADNSEPPAYNQAPTMSDKQVSALARDQLKSVKAPPPKPHDHQDSLFSRSKSKK